MVKISKSISELVGHTPLLEIVNYEKAHDLQAEIVVKLEFFNPNQSIKDRIALHMIEEAEAKGLIKPGDTLVETTSGNTGIGLAAIAAVKGYRFRVYLQDEVSEERLQVMKALGADAIRMSDHPVAAKALQETGGDFVAAVNALEQEVFAKEDVFFVNQLVNGDNPAAHFATTGPEIWEDTEGTVDILVAGVGTGGTISGTGKYLKSKNPDIQVVAVQPGPKSLPGPDGSMPDYMLSGVHPFKGMPAELVPKTLNQDILDEVLEIEAEDSIRVTREVAKTEGILLGDSSGAAIHAATILAQRPENKGKRIVVIAPDTGLRYLSTDLFEK